MPRDLSMAARIVATCCHASSPCIHSGRRVHRIGGYDKVEIDKAFAEQHVSIVVDGQSDGCPVQTLGNPKRVARTSQWL